MAGPPPRRRVGAGPERSPQEELDERLLDRREEIEAAALTRVRAVADPSEIQDPAYAEGLRAALRAAIDYGLASIASSDRSPPEIPPALLVQARVAARAGVSLDTVLRRYFAGYTLLEDFIIDEAEALDAFSGPELKRLLQGQASVFDRLLTAIGEEHAREEGRSPRTRMERRAQLAQRLLDGERLDSSDLAYDLQGHHFGLVAMGEGSEEALKPLAKGLDRRALVIRHEEEVWMWLGGTAPLDCGELAKLAVSALPERVLLALGEPGEGPDGWRLSHRQAKAALPIAVRGNRRIVRYSEVALLASVSQDDLLFASLRRLYLEPLEDERDGGRMMRETLRAYFATGRSVTSAAAVLGVSRPTISKRLRTIEERLGRPLDAAAIEIELALRLESWQAASPQIANP